MQTNYTWPVDVGFPGQEATLYETAGGRISVLLAMVAEVWTVTIAGTATDGVYSFLYRSGSLVKTVTVTRATTPSTNADIAQALLDFIQDDADLNREISGTRSSAVLTLTARYGGRPFELVTATAPSPGTMAVSNTVSPGSTTITPGRAVALNADGTGRQLASNDGEEDVAGIAVRHAANLRPDEGVDLGTEAYYAEGKYFCVRRDATPVWVEPTTAVAFGDPVHVYRTGTNVGKFRASPDGTAAALVLTPTAANTTDYSLFVTFRGVTYPALYTSDGSATAAEIVTGLTAALGSISGLTIGGTTTMTFASPAGEPVTLRSGGPGVLAESGTQATTTTILLAHAEWAGASVTNRDGNRRAKLRFNR